jgi:hypothetical protein
MNNRLFRGIVRKPIPTRQDRLKAVAEALKQRYNRRTAARAITNGTVRLDEQSIILEQTLERLGRVSVAKLEYDGFSRQWQLYRARPRVEWRMADQAADVEELLDYLDSAEFTFRADA